MRLILALASALISFRFFPPEVAASSVCFFADFLAFLLRLEEGASSSAGAASAGLELERWLDDCSTNVLLLRLRDLVFLRGASSSGKGSSGFAADLSFLLGLPLLAFGWFEAALGLGLGLRPRFFRSLPSATAWSWGLT